MHSLEAVIAAELARWPHRAVELDVFGTAEPGRIAEAMAAHCTRTGVGSPVGGLFYRSSAGCVAGMMLDNGDRVVLKVYQPRWSRSFLDTVQHVQQYLARRSFPCPRPIGEIEPLDGPLGRWAGVEQYLDDPGMRPLRGPAARRTAAAGLARQIDLCRDLSAPALAAHPLAPIPGSLYPVPHSPLFDFAASATGAGWIDAYARRALAQRSDIAPMAVVAHGDWSARNIRISGRTLVAAYDWDSLCLVPETTAVGQAAAIYSVTSEPGGSRFPSADEMRRFIGDYETARGRAFDAREWRAASGAATWVLAYTARCEHALEVASVARPDQRGARDRLSEEGADLLDLGGHRSGRT